MNEMNHVQIEAGDKRICPVCGVNEQVAVVGLWGPAFARACESCVEADIQRVFVEIARNANRA